MSFQIPQREVFQKTPNLRKTDVEKRYYAWLHDECWCCLSGLKQHLEIAHTGGQAQGKGMGRKAHLTTCLPLIRDLHHAEEKGRERFWRNAGIPDFLAWAERLYDIFEANDEPYHLLMDMHEKANANFIAEIIGKTTPAYRVNE